MNIRKIARAVWAWIRHPLLSWRTFRSPASQGEKLRRELRDTIRSIPEEELHENRVAFAQRFLAFSNRQRENWLRANGIPTTRREGFSVRQDQQRAAMTWFDRTHRGEG